MNSGEKINRFLTGGLLILIALISGFLTVNAFRYSYISAPTYVGYNWPRIIADSTFKNFILCLCGMILFSLIKYFTDKYPDFSRTFSGVLFIMTVIIYIIIGIIYVKNSPYYPSGDQLNTTACAYYNLQGDYIMYSPLGYIGIYPQQKGLVFLYEIFFRLFGPFNYTPVYILHLFCNVGAMSLCFITLRELSKDAAVLFTYNFFAIMFYPMFQYATYAYGDLLSIFFTALLWFSLVKFYKNKKKWYLILIALSAYFSFATRASAIIAIISLVITLLLIFIKDKKLIYVSALILVISVPLVLNTALNKYYEYKSGYDYHTGVPVTAFLAMGLMETDGAMGVYNNYNQKVYTVYDGDKKLASEEASAYIDARLDEFKENLQYARDFFLEKVRMQWLEPIYEVNTHTHSFKEDAPLYGIYIDMYYGSLFYIIFKFMNRHQSFMYFYLFAFATISLVKLFKKKESVEPALLFPLIMFVGGFLFSIIWEAKARYSLPYAFFLIIFIPMGMKNIYDFARDMVNKTEFIKQKH